MGPLLLTMQHEHDYQENKNGHLIQNSKNHTWTKTKYGYYENRIEFDVEEEGGDSLLGYYYVTAYAK
jgi:hypothetical protein